MKGTLYFIPILFLSLLNETNGDPRTKKVEIKCNTALEHNKTAYVPNFLSAMDNLANQIRNGGFGISNVGSGPDGNFGLAQCYGDLSSLDCVLCYAEARALLPQCFPNTGGRIYLDGCFMRSENYSFYKEYKGSEDKVICGNTSHMGTTFQQLVRQALRDATSKAPSNGGYARADVSASSASNESAHILANCWKTLDPRSCQACLSNASISLTKCLPMSEGRGLYTGCFLRYSDTDFLNAVQNSNHGKGSTVALIIAIVSALVVLVAGLLLGIFIVKHRRIQKKRKGSSDASKVASALNDSSLNFKYSVLEKATGSFSISNKLGQGGFGTVYKGVLADGREIAVKRLFFNNRHRATNFFNEVNMISSVEHRNLVRLLGCSCMGPESLLVYEFLPNLSLDRFLFDPDKGKALSWGKRFKIITGTAEGLAYLHENSKIRIIHRDVKSSNILLDLNFRAKIADFGLARSFQEDKSHISTAIAGTLGYIAPEYLAHGHLTEKVDVYSFGVLLLEVVTGRSNNRSKVYDHLARANDSSESLVTQVWLRFQSESLEELIDPNLMLHTHEDSDTMRMEILRVVHVGLLCTQEIPSLRPTMSRALQMLLKGDEHLPPPSRPPFTDEITMELDDMGDNHSSCATGSLSSVYPR